MIVEELFNRVPFAEVISRPKIKISGVSIDSNQIEPGDLFIPLIGEHYNGYKFINQALQKGAVAVAGDEIKIRKNHLACIFLPNAHHYLPLISAMVYGNPSKHLQVVGVTGTAGKTTTCHIIEAFLKTQRDHKVGYIGTTAYRWGNFYFDAPLTTPVSCQLQRMFRKMVDGNIKSAVVECSSHGIAQKRLKYTHFDVAVFTNLSQDHLDYHGNFVDYRNAKWQLFESLLVDSEKNPKHAVINVDDSTGRSWSKELLPRVETITYSIDPKNRADVFPESYKFTKDSILSRIHIRGEKLDIHAPMLGMFNLQNILASLAVASAMRLDLQRVKETLSQGIYVPGRMEKMVSTKDFHVYVDFAHTEDSLHRALETLERIKEKRIITVFGCGGDRDKLKRPKMGRVAAEKSDVVIVTSDNPRSEKPASIIDEIYSGIDSKFMTSKQILRNEDRLAAIEQALGMAQAGDIVLITGKGHEVVQEVNQFKYPFDDKKVVKEWVKDHA
jgi:UDP-N-acetylmuramoyl-L-alanyl-D-glutamate--2,6-diaminopimelate ligase